MTFEVKIPKVKEQKTFEIEKPKAKKCEYCKREKEDVMLREPKLMSGKMNLCKGCYNISDTQGFFYTFCTPD